MSFYISAVHYVSFKKPSRYALASVVNANPCTGQTGLRMRGADKNVRDSMAHMMPICVEELKKSYAGTPAVAGISFQVQAGETYALLGRDDDVTRGSKQRCIGVLSAALERGDLPGVAADRHDRVLFDRRVVYGCVPDPGSDTPESP